MSLFFYILFVYNCDVKMLAVVAFTPMSNNIESAFLLRCVTYSLFESLDVAVFDAGLNW